MTVSKWLVAIIVIVTLGGCVQVVEQQPEHSTVNLAISSVWDIPTAFPKNSKFYIHPRYLKKSSFYSGKQQEVYPYFQKAIEKSMREHGFVKAGKNADFVITFAVALESDLSDQEISKKFGVTPGLKTEKGTEKASLLIYIKNGETHESVWRGTVQGIVYKNTDDGQRQQRIMLVVNDVLSQFYKEN